MNGQREYLAVVKLHCSVFVNAVITTLIPNLVLVIALQGGCRQIEKGRCKRRIQDLGHMLYHERPETQLSKSKANVALPASNQAIS